MLARNIALTIVASVAATLAAPSPASAICTGCTSYKATLVCSARCVTGGYTLSIYKSDEPAVWLELNSSPADEYADPGRLNLVCSPGPGAYCNHGGTYIKVTDNAKFEDNYCSNAGVQIVGIVYKYTRWGSIGGLGSVQLAHLPDCESGEPNLLNRLASMYSSRRPGVVVPACEDPKCIVPSDTTTPHWNPPHGHLDAQWETHESQSSDSLKVVRSPYGPSAPESPVATPQPGGTIGYTATAPGTPVATFQPGRTAGYTATAPGSPVATFQPGVTAGYTAPETKVATPQPAPTTAPAPGGPVATFRPGGTAGYTVPETKVATPQPAPTTAPAPGSAVTTPRPAPTAVPGAPGSRVATLQPAAMTSALEILQLPAARSCLTTGGFIARDTSKKLSCYGLTQPAKPMAAIDTKVAGIASACWTSGGAVKLSRAGQVTCNPSMDAKAKKRTSGTSVGVIHDFPF